ncbi:MAG: SDR family oxidoreductase [Bacteroidia bacterium]|nr:SDR family oxidoreductase [Bacteroidia bacterium]
MTTLIAGASGATGTQLVNQLLEREQQVKVIVRSPEKLPDSWNNNDLVTIIKASILDISEAELAQHVEGCDAVASCLGHTLSWKGIYGDPRKLVTQSVINLCNAMKNSNTQGRKMKMVLMNTSGNQNRDLDEKISLGEKIVVGIIRFLLPPHVDNENAADYLRTEISQNNDNIEWVAIRPDNLTDEEKVTEYQAYPSPIRSAIFDAGKTSRINVGHFMASLITEDELWNKWKGQMPVLYNKSEKN